ncbi:bifunctional phosphopantothenoylcysteine decarboxylase/phosphopantothenate--cysteine ligase CoaBC [Candidatus Pacearchaeota archaeon]|nr:MAG: bifunctional phosphopantothenoylcysteine decarboxylase/phosphopantothenate--cysteine ligase CoaBC [Candidatus Pacearchaeota archaeon]
MQFVNNLKNKKILIGICGSVAIYKICEVIRRLKKEKAKIKVILTSGAEKFISPILFSTLAEEKAYTDKDYFRLNDIYTELSKFPELILVLPATASFLSKLASGKADELLLTVALFSKVPVYIFPAMNAAMWEHPTTQENIKILKNYGYFIYEPEEGELACKDVGKGRLPEPEEIVEVVKAHFTPKTFLNKKILITGGPTREYIDDVRFITNASSGKMAFYLTKEAYYRGAEVHLIWGLDEFPYTLPKLNFFGDIPYPKIYFVKTTKEMFEIAYKLFPSCDISIFSAAPCDFRPKKTYRGKIKKQKNFILELELTEDIAKTLTDMKKNNQITIGFALEEKEKIYKYALQKKKEKNFDYLIANPVTAMRAESSEFLFYTPNKVLKFENITKEELAKIVFNEIHF